jgi:hypothetical protein
MAVEKDDQILIKDSQGKIPMPQFKHKDTGKMVKILGKDAPFYQMLDDKGEIVGGTNPLTTKVAGTDLEEQLTEAQAASGKITFAQNLRTVEIFNTSNAKGTFKVNGINIVVPAGKSFKSNVGGTPSRVVEVSGATSYIVSRYV